ncbi:MAG: hypothetical protein WCE40_00435 [Polyangia bacterium]
MENLRTIERNMNILYLDDYMFDEEALLRESGVKCARKPLAEVFRSTASDELAGEAQYEVRGRRLSVEEYGRLFERCRASGVALATSPRAYEIGASFVKQYPILGAFSPRAMVASASLSDAELVGALVKEGLAPPVFVRSEIESAAKYVGADGCIAREATDKAIGVVVRNLRTHVQGFHSVIFKEMVDITTDPGCGARLEYRAISVRGHFLLFDFDESIRRGLPDPDCLGLRSFAERAFAALTSGGADGGLFVDIAVTGRGPIIVECKNLLNGTIRAVRRFGDAVVRLEAS